MSVLTDFYLAKPDCAKDYDIDQQCPEADRAQYKGITTLELSTLLAIVRKQQWNVGMMDEFPMIMNVGEGQRLIFEIPHSATECFASLSDSDIAVAADAWSRTDELSCGADDIRPVIEEIVRLSKRARETTRRLYLWVCV